MTSPALAVDAGERIGRLYLRPGQPLPAGADVDPQTGRVSMRRAAAQRAVLAGDLVPSITNILGVRNMPHLVPWAARMVAQEAIKVAREWPDHFASSPQKAAKWISGAADRDRDLAAHNGDAVHNACEAIARGQECPPLTADQMLYVDSWKAWLDRWQPEFVALESSVYGQTVTGLSYAGTGDLVFKANGLTVVADYKCSTLDTPVLMADGSTRPAGDVREGDSVVAWSEQAGLHVSRVAWVADNGKQETFVVRTGTGCEVEVTGQHPFLVERADDGRLMREWVRADQVRLGDAVVLGLGWEGSPVVGAGALDGDDAYLLGAFMAGSTWGAGPTWSFQCPDAGVRMHVAAHLARHGGRLIPASGGGYTVTGDRARSWLGSHGLAGAAATLGVPDAVRAGGPVVGASFIAGFLDVTERTQANPVTPGFTFECASARLRDEVRHVLANLDVKADVSSPVPASGRAETTVVDRYAVRRLTFLLTRVAPPSHTAREFASALPTPAVRVAPQRPDHYDLDTVVSVEHRRIPVATVAIEVEGAHTHVTGGVVTHNTTRAGVHEDVCAQLSAIAHADQISLDGGALSPMFEVDAAVAIHLSREGYQVRPCEIDGQVWDYFCALREAWDFHVLSGGLRDGSRALGQTLRGPEALVRTRPGVSAVA